MLKARQTLLASKITPANAVSRGTFSVNGAVMLVMFGIPALSYGATRILGFDGQIAVPVAGLAFFVGWPLAWLTWSSLVPRWRVWAYERVDDLGELKMRAVEAGLIWRDGHFFEKTEIRSKHQRQRIRELEQAWAAKREAGV